MNNLPPPTGDGFVTAKRLADFYAVTSPTIYNWAKNDKIPSLRFESTVRFDFDAVRAAIEHGGLCSWRIGPKRCSEMDGFQKVYCANPALPCGYFKPLDTLSSNEQILSVVLGIFSQQSVSFLANSPNRWQPLEEWYLDGWYEMYDLLVEFFETQ